MDLAEPPVVRVSPGGPLPIGDGVWPRTIPAIDQILTEGLDLNPGVTILLGENGSGKSTIVEAVASAYGLSPEGGSPFSYHSTRETESELCWAITLQQGVGRKRAGFFLRAETMHGWYTYIEQNPGQSTRGEPKYHDLSHGESFLAILGNRFAGPGLYCLDEPESALSFTSELALIGVLHDLAESGGQILCATHSPLLAALPGATILETGPWGVRTAKWEDLDLVRHWRQFLQDPQRYLRHLID